MTGPDRRSRLDRLVAEVRAQRPPPPREAGVPRRLFVELRSIAAAPRSVAAAPRSVAAAPRSVAVAPRSRVRANRAQSRWLPRVLLAAVLAGAAAFALGRLGEPELTLASAPRPLPGAVLDARPLAAGAAVVAREQPRQVEHTGHARWVLAPGSEARLLTVADGLVRVLLERGSLDADVVPSARAESFVVQAHGTEVAVHGTSFRVTLLGEQARVAVTHGRVWVRPVGQTAGTLLEAGMTGDFAAGRLQTPALPPADEAPAAPRPGAAEAVVPAPRSARPAPPSAVAPQDAPQAHPGAAVAPPAPSPPAAGAPEPPLDADPSVEPALQAVTERVQSCFQRNIPGSRDLGIEASTRLALWVEPSGALLRASFEPPLAPAVETCVSTQLQELELAPSRHGYRVEREIRLRR